MSDKIRELKAIFNSFDLKGTKETLEDSLSRFEARIAPYSDPLECQVASLWMKNIFLQAMEKYPEAEALLEQALSHIAMARNAIEPI